MKLALALVSSLFVVVVAVLYPVGASSLLQTATPLPVQPAKGEFCYLGNNLPVYKAQEGDTLQTVADYFDITVEGIAAVNCFENDPEMLLISTQIVYLPIPLELPEGNPEVEAAILESQPTLPPDFEPTLVPTSTEPVYIQPAIQPTLADVTLGSVVVAIQDIEVGTVMTEEMLVLVYVPTYKMPEDSIATLEDIVGQTSADSLEKWDILATTDLEDEA